MSILKSRNKKSDPQKYKCPNCGTIFEGMPKFCPNCNVEFGWNQNSTKNTNSKNNKKTKPKKNLHTKKEVKSESETNVKKVESNLPNGSGFKLFTKQESGKEIISKNKVILNLKSNCKYTITVTDDYVSIEQKGIMNTLNRGITGSKTFMFKNMSGLQYKKSGMTTGYLQLILVGSMESKGGVMSAVKDENTILFAKKEEHLILELKEYIEYKMSHIDKPHENTYDHLLYNELKDLKSLLDDGIITQSEFNEKKKQILGL